MRILVACFSATLLALPVANGQTITLLIPSFSDSVPGANGSLWQSELRFYNFTSAPQTGHIKLIPATGSSCPAEETVLIPPGASALRSLGCPGESLTAAEIAVDQSVRIDAILVNAAHIPEGCCIAGVSTTIPVTLVGTAYKSRGVVANVGLSSGQSRANLTIVNPGDERGLVVTVFSDPSIVLAFTKVIVPAHSVAQFNVFPHLIDAHKLPVNGYFAIAVAPGTTDPIGDPKLIYAFVSVIDNATGDSTVLPWTPGESVIR